MIAMGYRPWNTANATANISLLVKSGNKNTETKCKVCSNFFYQQIGCIRANFGQHTRGKPQSSDVNHNTILSTTRRPLGASYWGWVWAHQCSWAHQSDSSRKPSSSECNMLSQCVTLPESILQTTDFCFANFFSRNYRFFFINPEHLSHLISVLLF